VGGQALFFKLSVMDEKNTSSWDDLLQQLGAEPAPDALERKRPAIETQLEPPAAAAPPPKAKRGDWNALADQFGIEVPAEPEPPRKRSSATSETPTGGSEAMEASFAEIEPMESAFEEIIEEEISDVEFEVDDDFGGGEIVTAGEDSSALSGEAARNAFEALFQAGSFSALPPVEKPARKPEGRPGPQWRDINDKPRRQREEQPVEEDLEVEDLKEGAGEEGTIEDRERPKRRRRRGRGRGPGRQDRERPEHVPAEEGDRWDEASEAEHGEEEAEAGEREPKEAEGGEERPRRRRRRGRGGRSSSDRPARAESADGARDEAFDEEESDESSQGESHDHDDEDGDEEGPRGSHKNIPTWSEAIGVMVETNMQSRKSSPQRPGPPRDRARGGRGRGRGGRGRRS
jgi:hypothetical protein